MGLSPSNNSNSAVGNGPTGPTRRLASFDDDLLRLVPLLRPYAHALTRDRVAAEDLLQETFARAMTYHHKFPTGTNLRAWLYTMMRNLFIGEMRASSAFQSATDQLVNVMPTAIDSNQLAHLELKRLNQAIRTLPPGQRRAIHLVGRLGLTHQEAAKIEMRSGNHEK